MNNRLLAASLIAACVIPPAAQANVEIYGFASASVESVKATGATQPSQDVSSTTRISSNASRLGFKGKEDMGNGIKAVWQVEQTINLDGDGTGSWATRNSMVGLDFSQFGTIMLGNYDSAAKQLVKPVNPLPDTIADMCNKSVFCNGDDRLKNSVQYRSPDWNGFRMGLSYGAGEQSPDTSGRQDAYSVAAAYTAGGLNLGLGYTLRQDAVARNLDKSYVKAVINYTLPGIGTRIGAGWERRTLEQATGGDKSQNGWLVGASHQFGAVGAGLAYATMNDSGNGTEDGASQWTVSTTYNLSKRTQTYAYYTRIDNDAQARFDLPNNKIDGIGAGSSPTGFGVGIKHVF